MRFSVRCLDVCAGEERRILRKSAFWEVGVTEKRILRVAPSRKSAFWEAGVTEKRILGGWGHGKAHSACGPLTEKRILGGWGHGWRHNASARRTKSKGERDSARVVGAMSERAKASSSRGRSKPHADKELRIVFLRWAKDASMT